MSQWYNQVRTAGAYEQGEHLIGPGTMIITWKCCWIVF